MNRLFFWATFLIAIQISAFQVARSQTEAAKLNVGDASINGLTVKPNVVRVNETIEKDGKVNKLSFTLETSLEEINGKKVLRAVSKDAESHPTGEILMDAKTLAPIKMSQSMGGRSLMLDFDGPKLRVASKTAPESEPQTNEKTLSAVPFIGSASDVVISAMKLKEGMKFMLPIYFPGAPDVEWQTFEVTGHEDLKTSSGTVSVWVVKHEGNLSGTMYTVDRPPYLVRWVLNQKNGTRITIDQDLVSQ